MEALHYHQDFLPSFEVLRNKAGPFRGPSDKIAGILHAFGQGDNPRTVLNKFPITNNGENRVKSCVKYNIGGPSSGCRLITIQAKNIILLCFAGDHDSAKKWLDKNRGREFHVDPKRGEIVSTRTFQGKDWGKDFLNLGGNQRLIDLLDNDDIDNLYEILPTQIIRPLNELKSDCMPSEVDDLCLSLESKILSTLLMNIINALLRDRVDEAKNFIRKHQKKIISIEEADPGDLLKVTEGPNTRTFKIGSPEYSKFMKKLSSTSTFADWFLFTHPDQQEIVDYDFTGPTKLSGISGSGKTCIVIKRAIRIANENTEPNILLVTLNPSLAKLIEKLVDLSITDKRVRERIKVHSLFSILQEILSNFEPGREKYYSDVDEKLNEHVDELFVEFYRCWNNNKDASVLDRVHKNLTARGINAALYIRDEFDWIRSGWPKEKRGSYLEESRVGRQERLDKQSKEEILTGLEKWENKMEACGIIDYLGLTTAVVRYVNKIEAKYSHLMVDEAQDFGTTELSILKRLVKNESELFYCGDISQSVLPKHRDWKAVGVDFNKGNQRKIVRNYRNTKQILDLAYAVLVDNINDEMDARPGDLELLDPKHSTRSGDKPYIYQGENLGKEFASAMQYAKDYIAENNTAKCCIAFAGFSYLEISTFARKLKLNVLYGHSEEVLSEPLVLSDLEQTKGYEFDLMIIVNCSKGQFPPDYIEEEEKFRYGSQLYVAMTRAKEELIISFSGEKSEWLDIEKQLTDEAFWSDWEYKLEERFNCTPEKTEDKQMVEEGQEIEKMDGKQFCYTREAIGMTRELQDKLLDLVDGKGAIRSGDGNNIRWKSIGDAHRDVMSNPIAKRIFGVHAEEFLNILDRG